MKRTKPNDVSHISEPLRVHAMPIGTLHHQDGNARLHDERNLEAVKASLQQFGQQKPIVYTVRGRKKLVVAGNGCLAAARALGWKSIAAVPTALADAAARAFAIADNRSSDLSTFDGELLAAELAELKIEDVDIDKLGFSDEELNELLAQVGTPPAEPTTADGDGDEDQKGPDSTRFYRVVVQCKNERQQKRLFNKLKGEGYTCKLMML